MSNVCRLCGRVDSEAAFFSPVRPIIGVSCSKSSFLIAPQGGGDHQILPRAEYSGSVLGVVIGLIRKRCAAPTWLFQG
jgi:hypothetical protein